MLPSETAGGGISLSASGKLITVASAGTANTGDADGIAYIKAPNFVIVLVGNDKIVIDGYKLIDVNTVSAGTSGAHRA